MTSSLAETGIEASIIIIGWRVVEELRECLDSIKASVNPPSHEVIVVLNGTSDATAAIAHGHPAVTRVIDRAANIGFGAAGNLAASVASGTNLIFLNDDARVDKDWLRTIVDASKASNENRAIASVLLNDDGTVQEAGSRILSHGGTHQWGAGLTVAQAQENGMAARRPIDYGSAAALLVKRATFEKLGGFDAMYEPAYFEDVDLQMRLRESGVEIWLEPEALVTHHSGLSTTNDHWFKKFAADRSGTRFIERWAGVLATSPGDDAPVDELCVVPLSERPASQHPLIDPAVDDSLHRALEMAADYEKWMAHQLDQLEQYRAELVNDPTAPTRSELLDRLHELKGRIEDIENRSVFGLLKMKAGSKLNELRNRRNA